MLITRFYPLTHNFIHLSFLIDPLMVHPSITNPRRRSRALLCCHRHVFHGARCLGPQMAVWPQRLTEQIMISCPTCLKHVGSILSSDPTLKPPKSKDTQLHPFLPPDSGSFQAYFTFNAENTTISCCICLFCIFMKPSMWFPHWCKAHLTQNTE